MMLFGSSVEIRTSYPFHAERPSHCPMMLNEQREAHADEFIQLFHIVNTSSMWLSATPTGALQWGMSIKTSHEHLSLPCP